MKNKLMSLIGGVVLGAFVLLPKEADAQRLRIANYSSSGGNLNSEYVANGTNTTYTVNANNFQIYDTTSAGQTNKSTGVDINSNNLFQIIMAYKGTVTNGIKNAQRVQFLDASGTNKIYGNSFPTNIAVTYKTIDKNGTRVFDLGKECAGLTNYFEITMPTTSNAVPGNYATNYLSFTLKESSTSELENITINNNQAKMNVKKVLPGANVILDYSTNLITDAFEAIKTNYVPVTLDNFNSTSSTTFTNLDLTGPQGFFRTRVE